MRSGGTSWRSRRERSIPESAAKLAAKLEEQPDTDLNSLLSDERKLAHGYWNYADEDEFLVPVTLPVSQALDLVMSGAISDGKTAFALLKAARYLGL